MSTDSSSNVIQLNYSLVTSDTYFDLSVNFTVNNMQIYKNLDDAVNAYNNLPSPIKTDVLLHKTKDYVLILM
jgi:hypothetical protein